ncbi:hypothetical protein MC885_017224, partial [Smutsia gigantea]
MVERVPKEGGIDFEKEEEGAEEEEAAKEKSEEAKEEEEGKAKKPKKPRRTRKKTSFITLDEALDITNQKIQEKIIKEKSEKNLEQRRAAGEVVMEPANLLAEEKGKDLLRRHRKKLRFAVKKSRIPVAPQALSGKALTRYALICFFLKLDIAIGAPRTGAGWQAVAAALSTVAMGRNSASA